METVRPKPRKIILRLFQAIVAVLVLGYLGICLLVFIFQRDLLYHPIIRSAAEVDQLAQAAHMERWTNAAGQPIGLKRMYPNQAAEGAILMLYGNASTAVHCAIYADAIQKTAPFDFYVVEYPGFEDRPGPSTRETLLNAATEAFNSLNTREPVYLVGESLGTGPASYLAGQFPDKITGVMLLSPYYRLADVAQSHYPFLPARYLLHDDFYSAQYLQSYHGLVGIMIDGRDTIVPARFGQRLYDGFTGPKRLWQYPDCEHVQLGESPETFWKSVREFWRTANVTRVAAKN